MEPPRSLKDKEYARGAKQRPSRPLCEGSENVELLSCEAHTAPRRSQMTRLPGWLLAAMLEWSSTPEYPQAGSKMNG